MKRMEIREILERYLEQTATLSGDEAQFYCPFCIDRLGAEGTDRNLWVNLKSGKGYCYRCEAKFGSARSVLRALGVRLSRDENLSLLLHDAPTAPAEPSELTGAVEASLHPPKAGAQSLPVRLPVPLPAECVQLTADTCDLPRFRRAWTYLQRRGATVEQVARWRIGYCPSGRCALHLVFPVCQGGSVVYYTTRATHDVPPKSRNPENQEGHHTRQTVLLGYDQARGRARIEVAEGPFSALALPNAVALLGKHASAEQVDLLVSLRACGTQEVVVALDQDARREAVELHARLTPLFPRVSCLMLARGDPDENRVRLPAYLEQRRSPTLVDAVAGVLR